VATLQERTSTWLRQDLRKVSAAATAGLVAGFVVNGVGSRLAMMLLARLNPQVTGRLSDDGFRMGQFTLADTAGLVFFGTAVGVLGGLLFLAVRHLRFGPAWFRTASIVVGPAVVVGSMLVHTDGIDFRVLEPTWLAIGLFVALPGLFAFVVSGLVDHWLRDDAWPQRTKRVWAAGLVAVILLGPAMLPVAGGLLARGAHQVIPALRNVTATRVWGNAVRGALIVVFALALRSLLADVVVLTRG
jgi:hypothetical protein